eukprot:130958_1
MDNIFNEITNELIASGYNKQNIVNCIENVKKRLQWDVNSSCLIYSRGDKRWYKGEIFDIFEHNKTNEEWFLIKYNKKTKPMQRFCKDIKPVDFNYDCEHTIIEYIATKMKEKTQTIYSDDIDKNKDVQEKNNLLQKIKKWKFPGFNDDKKVLVEKLKILESENDKFKKDQKEFHSLRETVNNLKSRIDMSFTLQPEKSQQSHILQKQADNYDDNKELKDEYNFTKNDLLQKVEKLKAQNDKELNLLIQGLHNLQLKNNGIILYNIFDKIYNTNHTSQSTSQPYSIISYVIYNYITIS